MAQLCWAATALLVAATVALGVALLASPPRVPVTSDAPVATAPDRAGPAGPPPYEAFADAWTTDLRGPLEDPPQAAPVAPKKPAPPLAVQLAGTVVESGDAGRSKAVFASGGRVELKGVGETAGGAKVVEVTEGRVTLLHRGERVVLRLPKRKPGGAE